jgi:tryptophan-rich sensory protein
MAKIYQLGKSYNYDFTILLFHYFNTSRPSFSPHLWFVSRIWREIITIEAIAGVNLYKVLRQN